MDKKQVTIRMPEQTWRNFKHASIDAGKPMNVITLELIEEWLKKLRDKNAQSL
jgi:predicted DNA-binding protein